jgi:hypothetical protein
MDTSSSEEYSDSNEISDDEGSPSAAAPSLAATDVPNLRPTRKLPTLLSVQQKREIRDLIISGEFGETHREDYDVSASVVKRIKASIPKELLNAKPRKPTRKLTDQEQKAVRNLFIKRGTIKTVTEKYPISEWDARRIRATIPKELLNEKPRKPRNPPTKLTEPQKEDVRKLFIKGEVNETARENYSISERTARRIKATIPKELLNEKPRKPRSAPKKLTGQEEEVVRNLFIDRTSTKTVREKYPISEREARRIKATIPKELLNAEPRKRPTKLTEQEKKDIQKLILSGKFDEIAREEYDISEGMVKKIRASIPKELLQAVPPMHSTKLIVCSERQAAKIKQKRGPAPLNDSNGSVHVDEASMLDPLTPNIDETPGGNTALTRIPEHISPAGSILGVNGSSIEASSSTSEHYLYQGSSLGVPGDQDRFACAPSPYGELPADGPPAQTEANGGPVSSSILSEVEPLDFNVQDILTRIDPQLQPLLTIRDWQKGDIIGIAPAPPSDLGEMTMKLWGENGWEAAVVEHFRAGVRVGSPAEYPEHAYYMQSDGTRHGITKKCRLRDLLKRAASDSLADVPGVVFSSIYQGIPLTVQPWTPSPQEITNELGTPNPPTQQPGGYADISGYGEPSMLPNVGASEMHEVEAFQNMQIGQNMDPPMQPLSRFGAFRDSSMLRGDEESSSWDSNGFDDQPQRRRHHAMSHSSLSRAATEQSLKRKAADEEERRQAPASLRSTMIGAHLSANASLPEDLRGKGRSEIPLEEPRRQSLERSKRR